MQSIAEHLRERHFDTSIHPAWIDEENRSATFPIYNLTGQMVAYQRYRPDSSKTMSNDPRESRYYLKILRWNPSVWGLESWHFSNTLFIVEGVFDACRLTGVGLSAIATMANNPKYLRDWFRVVRASRPVVAVPDADSASVYLRNYAHEWVEPDAKDLGDASQEFVMNLVEKYG